MFSLDITPHWHNSDFKHPERSLKKSSSLQKSILNHSNTSSIKLFEYANRYKFTQTSFEETTRQALYCELVKFLIALADDKFHQAEDDQQPVYTSTDHRILRNTVVGSFAHFGLKQIWNIILQTHHCMHLNNAFGRMFGRISH